MSTIDPGVQASTAGPYAEPEGAGWIVFAGIMMMFVAILNVFYGMAAIGTSRSFVGNQRYIVGDFKTWGWVRLVVGVVQAFAAYSIWAGNQFGRWSAFSSPA